VWAAAAGGSLMRRVNPIRFAYIVAAAAGLALFLWIFITLRFNEEWIYVGWDWRGPLPLAAMGAGVALMVVGIAGARRWKYVRWQHRRRRAAPSH